MKKRWISLLLVLALVLAVWSVCAVAADAQKADETTEETTADETAAEEPTEEEDPAEETEPAEEAEAASTDAEAPEADGEQNHIHAVNREDGCEEPSFAPLTVTGGKLESGCYYLTDDLALTEPLCVPKNGAQVTLCLNGHTLSLADGAEGCIVFLAVSSPSPTATARAAPAIITSTRPARSSLTTAATRGRRPISRRAKRTRLPEAGSPAQLQARSVWAIITSFT